MPPITFNLPGLPPSPNKRLHHMARWRANQEWKGWSMLAARDAANRSGVKGLPWSKVHVLYTFHYPRVARLDLDNAVASGKPILDGCRGILVVDDDNAHVHRVSAEVVIRREVRAGVEVSVEECTCES